MITDKHRAPTPAPEAIHHDSRTGRGRLRVHPWSSVFICGMRFLACCVATVAFTMPAAGYELLRVNNDPCARGDRNLFWPGAHATVSVGLLSEPYRGLASEAAQRWNLSLGRFRFDFGSGAACTRDGVATLVIDDVPCGLSAFGDALAITRSVWKTDTGELV